MRKALVFGVCQEMGSNLCHALVQHGWEVVGIVKNSDDNAPIIGNLTLVELEANDLDFLYQLAPDVDTIFFHQEETNSNNRDLTFKLEQIITLAELFHLQLIITTNKYHIKQKSSPALTFCDNKHPVRVGLSPRFTNRLRQAEKAGAKILVLCFGHTLSFSHNTCYLGMLIKETEHKLIIQSPSSEMLAHYWTYLPDLAANLVQLVTLRQLDFSAFNVIYYPGHKASMNDIARCLALSTGKTVAITPLYWSVMKLIALFSPLFRGFLRIRSLWQQGVNLPINAIGGISTSKFIHTPLELALQRCWNNK
ncbi:hypothetical protein [Photobacterium sp.]|uniref:hypothetical protein n=1 Tax=Photobacterium sp. TaxID=660 RepID=UPI00299D45B8|nr:hypothetical protein [Photobacterium sp.]MDX1303088.1 hypothetical protein [Photobacterium sp.]